VEGFGVLTEIDLKATLKETGCRFYNYTILGNPASAYKATGRDKIGTMLPCNVIVQEKGQVEVSAVDPAASMQAVESAALG
jgi:uncharacterized protein (DUF302 family)